MKRLISLFLAIILMFAVSGCGASDGSTSADNASASSAANQSEVLSPVAEYLCGETWVSLCGSDSVTMRFLEDGTLVEVNPFLDITGEDPDTTWELSGDTVTFTYSNGNKLELKMEEAYGTTVLTADVALDYFAFANKSILVRSDMRDEAIEQFKAEAIDLNEYYAQCREKGVLPDGTQVVTFTGTALDPVIESIRTRLSFDLGGDERVEANSKILFCNFAYAYAKNRDVDFKEGENLTVYGFCDISSISPDDSAYVAWIEPSIAE